MSIDIHARLVSALPELKDMPEVFARQVIYLRDDSDGVGAYIAEWNYAKPLPAGFTVGKPEL